MVKKFFRDHSVHKKIVPFLDYFFILRPTYFFNVWLSFLSGMYVIQFSIFPNDLWGVNLTTNSILLILGITLFSAGCFINWQLKSKSNFKLQNKVSLFEDKISVSLGKKIQYICIITGGIIVLILDFMVIPILILILFLTTSILKSQKNETLINELVLFSTLLFLAGITHNFFRIGESFNLQYVINLIPLVFLIIISAIIHQLSRDRNFNKFTFQIIAATFLCVISILLGIVNNDPISATAPITILPFIFMLIIRNNEIDQLRAVRYSILIMTVFLFSTYPQFIWLSFILYFISKYYYWHRFDFHYPKLVLENDRNYTK